MVKIISDSTCDLSPELVNRYDIDILPLHILLGEKLSVFQYHQVCQLPEMLCVLLLMSWKPLIL